MAVRPVETPEDLQAALARMEALWPKKDKSTKAADELKVLAVLVEDYERRTVPMLRPRRSKRFAFEWTSWASRRFSSRNISARRVLGQAKFSMGKGLSRLR